MSDLGGQRKSNSTILIDKPIINHQLAMIYNDQQERRDELEKKKHKCVIL